MRSVVCLLAVVLGLGLSACSDIRDQMDELSSDTAELTDQARFCLSVARALSAMDAGSPETAAAAAEELLAQAPEDLRDDARTVASALRDARDGDSEPLADPETREAAERLQEGTRELCDPTS